MILSNKPRVLASTYNPVSNTKMISFLVDFPTVLLAELRTHRILTQGSLYEHSELVDFNLSANSARAIPHNKYLQKVLDNPFVPIWTKQQKGMSGELCDENTIKRSNQQWNQALIGVKVGRGSNRQQIEKGVINRYDTLLDLGVHKQNANRLLAPFAYTTCIISGTEFENFFELRCPKYLSLDGNYYKSKKECMFFNRLYSGVNDLEEPNWNENNYSTAQPEFQVIAEMLYDLYQEANWKESKYHIPFEDDIKKLYWEKDLDKNPNYKFGVEEMEMMMSISASMCAKLSYNTQDNEDTLEKHLERANMLIKHKHSEPFSHQAIAMDKDEYENMFIQSIVNVNGKKERKREMGVAYNLRGFKSFRYIIENEQ